MKPTIWIYWENATNTTEPILVSRCKDIFRQYDNVIILNEHTIHDYVELVNCQHLSLNHKGDYYRAKLLAKHGGIWFDVDSVLLDDFGHLYEQLMTSEFELCAEYANSVCAPAALLFKPNSTIANLWSKKCEDLITSHKALEWGELGGCGLGEIVQNNLDKLMTMAGSNIFSLGYENNSYMSYYSTDPVFIDQQLNQIRAQKAKVITLYGTFMYRIPIPEHCLLEQMWKMAILPPAIL